VGSWLVEGLLAERVTDRNRPTIDRVRLSTQSAGVGGLVWSGLLSVCGPVPSRRCGINHGGPTDSELLDGRRTDVVSSAGDNRCDNLISVDALELKKRRHLANTGRELQQTDRDVMGTDSRASAVTFWDITTIRGLDRRSRADHTVGANTVKMHVIFT